MPDLTCLSDTELLQLLHASDEQAFTEIYNRYWEKLLAMGYYYTRNKAAAEDIVHQVMMGLWIRREELIIKSLEAYLAIAIKFSVFKAIARKKRRNDLLTEQRWSPPFSTIEEKLDARFLEEYLHGAVAQLPPKTRLVFTYSRSEALTINQIADKMELSPKTVEYHLTKALKALRKSLQKLKSFFV